MDNLIDQLMDVAGTYYPTNAIREYWGRPGDLPLDDPLAEFITEAIVEFDLERTGVKEELPGILLEAADTLILIATQIEDTLRGRDLDIDGGTRDREEGPVQGVQELRAIRGDSE